MNMVILADVWKNYPLVALIVLAALQTIPRDLYQAAAIDGAGPWTRFWKITFPHILGPLTVALILRMIEAFKVFDIIYVMTRGGPADVHQDRQLLRLPGILQLSARRQRCCLCPGGDADQRGDDRRYITLLRRRERAS